MNNRTEKESALLEILERPARINRNYWILSAEHDLLSDQIRLNMVDPEEAEQRLEAMEARLRKLVDQNNAAVWEAFDTICKMPDETPEDDMEKTVLICYYLGRKTMNQMSEILEKSPRMLHMYKAKGLKHLAELLPETRARTHSA